MAERTPESCDLCGSEKLPVLRFGLMRKYRRRDGRMTTRGAGGVYICQRCWLSLRRRGRAYGNRYSLDASGPD